MQSRKYYIVTVSSPRNGPFLLPRESSCTHVPTFDLNPWSFPKKTKATLFLEPDGGALCERVQHVIGPIQMGRILRTSSSLANESSLESTAPLGGHFVKSLMKWLIYCLNSMINTWLENMFKLKPDG